MYDLDLMYLPASFTTVLLLERQSLHCHLVPVFTHMQLHSLTTEWKQCSAQTAHLFEALPPPPEIMEKNQLLSFHHVCS